MLKFRSGVENVFPFSHIRFSIFSLYIVKFPCNDRITRVRSLLLFSAYVSLLNLGEHLFRELKLTL